MKFNVIIKNEIKNQRLHENSSSGKVINSFQLFGHIMHTASRIEVNKKY